MDYTIFPKQDVLERLEAAKRSGGLCKEAASEIRKLHAEIKEYEEMAYRFACVLDHATGGYLSKTNYDKDTMYAAIDDHVHRQCDEALKDALEGK